MTLDTSDYIDFEKDVYVKHYSTENGLGQVSASALNVDENGILWVSTEMEVLSYDGDVISSNYDLPPNKSIAKLPDGSLQNQSYRMENGRLVSFEHNLGNEFYVDIRGFYKYVDSTQEHFSAYRDIGKAGRYSRTKSGDLYACNRRGVIYYNENHWDTIYKGRIQEDYTFATDSSFYFMQDDHLIKKYKQGKYIGAYQLKGFSPELKVYWGYNPHSTYFYDKGDLYRFLETANGPTLQLWIKNLNVLGLKRVLEMKSQDSSEVFFLGTITNGFYHCKPKVLESKGLATDEGEVNVVYSHVELNGDSLLTGLGVIMNKDRTYRRYSERALGSRAMLKDSKGRIWTSYQDHENGFIGSAYLDPEKGFEPYLLNERVDGHFVEGFDGRILKNRKDTIFQFNESQKVFEVYAILPKEKKWALKRMHANPYVDEVWLTIDETKKIYKITEGGQKVEELPFWIRTSSVLFDEDGKVWMAPRRMDPVVYYKDSLYPLPLDQNGYLKTSHCIMEDDNGYLWISCNNGIFQAAKSDLVAYIEGKTDDVYYYFWGLNDGIDGYELNGGCTPCGIKLSSGKFSFPSLNGVVQFDPLKTRPILPTSPIHITAFRVNEQDTLLVEGALLDAGIEQLEFKVTAPYFGEKINQGNLEFQLQGLHSRWYPLRQDKLISFDNLDQGNYSLKIRRRAGFGVDNYTQTEFSFKVAKFYYQTSWFRLGMIFLAFALIGLLFYLRAQVARRRRRELETIIEEKTEDYRVLNSKLQNNVDELNVSQQTLKKILEDRDRMMGIYAHDIRGPLRHMSYMAERNMEKHKELEAEDIKKWFQVFAHTANGVYEQTERMFHWISGQGNGIKLEQMSMCLRDMIHESTRFFRDQAMAKNIEFQNNIDPDYFIHTDPNIFRITINNIIDNSIKFTEFGAIGFSVMEDEKRVMLNIKDTGVGMNAARVEKLNSGIYETTTGTNNESGKGFGLSAIKKLLSELGGTLVIESELKVGTTVSVFLPKTQE